MMLIFTKFGFIQENLIVINILTETSTNGKFHRNNIN